VNLLLQVDDTFREAVSKRDYLFRPYFSVVMTNTVKKKKVVSRYRPGCGLEGG